MKKNKKIFFTIVGILLILSFLISACGVSQKEESAQSISGEAAKAPDYAYDQAIVVEDVGSDLNFTATSNTSLPQSQNVESPSRMMIYTGQLEIEVDDLNKAIAYVIQEVENKNGYTIKSTQSENDYRLSAHFEFSIPVIGFEPIIENLSNIPFGKVNYQNVNGQDVTEEYLDLESRLKAKRIYEERLLEFLQSATKTEDLLKISNDLNRVQEEIEQIVGRQKYLSHYAAYSTLIIDIEQFKNKVAPTASTIEKSKDGFLRSLNLIKDLFTGLFVISVSYFPIIILILLGLFIVWKLVKRLVRRPERVSEAERDNLES